MGFLRYDSDFMIFLGRLADLMWLNILCFVCSLPIITFGAAVSAKYYTAMKLERGEATGVTKAFFHSFKQNLAQNTWLSIIVLIIVFFFGWNWLLVYGGTLTNTIVVGLLAIFTVMFAITVFCMFPMLARFETKNFAAFRNALVFGIVHLPRVVLGVAMAVAPLIISYYNIKWAWLICLSISTLTLYYNAIFFIKKFQILEEQTFGEVQNPYNPDGTPADEELKPLDFDEEDASEEYGTVKTESTDDAAAESEEAAKSEIKDKKAESAKKDNKDKNAEAAKKDNKNKKTDTAKRDNKDKKAESANEDKSEKAAESVKEVKAEKTENAVKNNKNSNNGNNRNNKKSSNKGRSKSGKKSNAGANNKNGNKKVSEDGGNK